MTYRGESDSKKITREFVWWQHQRILGSGVFLRTPKVFLASRVCGDLPTLLRLKIPVKNIWAVEHDFEEARMLMAQKQAGTLDCRVFGDKVEHVLQQHARGSEIAPFGLPDVYLDFCGTVQGMKRAIQESVACLPKQTALSVTLLPMRELEPLEATREVTLTRIIQAATPHKVALVQSIHYKSGPKTPMETWTYAIGCKDIVSRGKMRFDLTTLNVGSISKSLADIRKVWDAELRAAERRSQGAFKANQVRRVA